MEVVRQIMNSALTRYGTRWRMSCHLTAPCLTHRDYRPNEVLDAYEEEGIDEAPEAEDATLEEQLAARARAERELNKRDRRENRRGLPGALEGMYSKNQDARLA